MSQNAIYLCNYTPPPYRIEKVELRFELDEQRTIVHSKIEIHRIGTERKLRLDGQNLILHHLLIDGRELHPPEFIVDTESLTIAQVPDQFVLEVETEICPQQNTALEGLYASSGNLSTQCEPEGFRHITYYLDRPDVMAPFTTTLMANRERFPILLSNGNPGAHGELADARHYATWIDPFPKPSYLFALVAGDLTCISDRYVTNSGREISLRIYVQHQNADQCAHALASLKNAMRWDEQVYGREYDLEIYQIVAVDDFNMGAMENKGLNIFNSRYVLARPETATDDDFENIESVIAHEYFHNWSGNRVTCRDWFQLSLKEGFTVFRDQQFTADMTSAAVKRIKDVQRLRTAQFREDAGPLSHPVRPDSYLEINNFYTTTIYEKGAEVVRMAYNLLGPISFRRGTDLYFSRHDGQAVTTDDFLRALEDASGRDLGQFRNWYSQAGTPVLNCQGVYDAQNSIYTLTIQQSCPPTPGQKNKEPFHLPLAVGLLDNLGNDLLPGDSQFASGTQILELRARHEVFQFTGITTTPIPSLLRHFSAPVKIEADYSDADLAVLMKYDSDLFNRWDAGQQLSVRLFKRLWTDYCAGRELIAPQLLSASIAHLLDDDITDRRLVAEALTLPSESYLAEQIAPIDPQAIHQIRRFLRRNLAVQLRAQFLNRYHLSKHELNCADSIAIGRRRLKNICLGYLMEIADDEIRDLCAAQFYSAENMTDAIAALNYFSNSDCPERQRLLDDFYQKWNNYPLVIDKWFSLQATSYLPNTLDTVRNLLIHPDFRLTNPNKVRAVIGSFCHGNPINFHAPDGSGYAFLAEQILILDPINPQIAARLLNALSDWRRYEPIRQSAMRQILRDILAESNLSKDIYEIASKSLCE